MRDNCTGPEGLEPPTCCLEGSCSILLSYDPPKEIGVFSCIFLGFTISCPHVMLKEDVWIPT